MPPGATLVVIAGGVVGLLFVLVVGMRLGTHVGFGAESALVGMALLGAVAGGFLAYVMVMKGWIPTAWITPQINHGILGFFIGGIGGFYLLNGISEALDAKLSKLSEQQLEKLFRIGLLFPLLTAVVGAVAGYQFT